MRTGLKPIGLLLVLVLVTVPAVAGEQWLHVRVEGRGGSDERVNVNIPLGLVESMLPLISVDELDRGRLRIDELDTAEFDLREILRALRESPDSTFMRAQSDDEKVHVAKQGDYLLINVDERGRGSEKVRIRVPLRVFDAMVGTRPNELDLLAGLRALREFEGEDLIHIESDDETVRVWIDSDNEGN